MLRPASSAGSRTIPYPAPAPAPRPPSASPPPELPSLRDYPNSAPLSSSLHQSSSIATSVSTFLPASSLFQRLLNTSFTNQDITSGPHLPCPQHPISQRIAIV